MQDMDSANKPIVVAIAWYRGDIEPQPPIAKLGLWRSRTFYIFPMFIRLPGSKAKKGILNQDTGLIFDDAFFLRRFHV